MREREMLKVTKCLRVNSSVGALINMVYELKNTSGSKKKICENFMVIQRCVRKLLAKKVLRGHEIHSKSVLEGNPVNNGKHVAITVLQALRTVRPSTTPTGYWGDNKCHALIPLRG